MTNLAIILAAVNGASFAGIDTEVQVSLKGGKANPHKGRVTKRTTGSQVMLFQNKKGSAYEAMVKRRLEAEGKDPASFVLSPRKWGDRLPNTPVVRHTLAGTGERCYYFEAIFLKGGRSEYFLDGSPIAKADIIGLDEDKDEAEQGGLDNKVIIRTYKLDSVREIRMEGKSYAGPFFWDADIALGLERA